MYRRVLYTIKDYDRRKDEYLEILHSSPKPNIDTGKDSNGKTVSQFGAKANELSLPTEAKALKLSTLSCELHAIEQALMEIPMEYRKDVFDGIRYGKRCPETAHHNTWQQWKQRFIFHVAKKLGLL